MTILEIILMLIIWVFVGCFICHKRKWYKTWGNHSTTSNDYCAFTICLAPFALCFAFFREFILDDWNDKNFKG